MSTMAIDDVEPKAVMSEEEQARWAELPPGVQLERLRAALQRGAESGVSSRSMDDIWKKVLAEFPDARL